MITLKRILVPHDFSETSEAAMKYATELARIFGAKLHVLHVSETARTDMPTEFPLGLEEGMEEEVRERLLKTVPGRDKREFNPNFELRSGTPSAEIVRFAKERDIDLIVMGTHGRGFIAHVAMGSVTEKVVRNAPCPVLTLPWLVVCPRRGVSACVRALSGIYPAFGLCLSMSSGAGRGGCGGMLSDVYVRVDTGWRSA